MNTVTINRKTAETDISLTLARGTGMADINTGCGFLDHMLTLFARHSGLNLTLTCKGDLAVDAHHTAAVADSEEHIVGQIPRVRAYSAAVGMTGNYRTPSDLYQVPKTCIRQMRYVGKDILPFHLTDKIPTAGR